MAYRSGEPTVMELRERRVRMRREHDELQERADRLAGEIAEASRGGVLGAIGNLIGGKSENELARARADHAALETELAAFVQRERDLDAELARLEVMQADLATQEATRITAARAAPGPLGDQLRAIAAERDVVTGRLAAFDGVLGELRRAATVAEELGGIENDARVASSPAVVVTKAVHDIAGALTGGDIHTGDRETMDARRSSHVELACTMIQSFLAGFARLAHTWPDPKPIELATRQLASFTTRAFDASSARTCLERIELAMAAERNVMEHALAQLDARERDLVRV